MVSIPIVMKIRLSGVYMIRCDPEVGPLNHNSSVKKTLKSKIPNPTFTISISYQMIDISLHIKKKRFLLMGNVFFIIKIKITVFFQHILMH